MNRQGDTGTAKTLLVFNCHEPWVYPLGMLGYALDIIVGLKGKYNKGWDYCMRPLPAHARLITLPQALQSPQDYYCLITHNTTDLLDVRSRPSRVCSCCTILWRAGFERSSPRSTRRR